jgi:hypothetical protein
MLATPDVRRALGIIPFGIIPGLRLALVPSRQFSGKPSGMIWAIASRNIMLGAPGPDIFVTWMARVVLNMPLF